MLGESIKHKPVAVRVRTIWIILLGCLAVLVLAWILTSKIGKKSNDEIFEQVNGTFKSSQEYWKSVAPENLQK